MYLPAHPIIPNALTIVSTLIAALSYCDNRWGHWGVNPPTLPYIYAWRTWHGERAWGHARSPYVHIHRCTHSAMGATVYVCICMHACRHRDNHAYDDGVITMYEDVIAMAILGSAA